MVTWGLGIEHEFVLKFEKKKNYNNTFYDLFLNSKLIYNLTDFNEINFYQKYKSFIKNNIYYKDYILYIEDLIKIRNLAINKKKYPFDKKNFFNIITTNSSNIIYKLDNYTISKMKNYLFYYVLYHEPILFFSYNFNGDEYESNDFEGLFLKSSYNKEELIKYNYDLFNILMEFNDIKDIKNKILSNFSNNFELYRIWASERIYFKKSSNGNIKSKKDFIDLINTQAKYLKKFLFNDININSNLIENIFYCYRNKIPKLDVSRSSWVIEMMTIDYKNKNYEKTYKDFIKYENSYIEYANTIINNYLKKYGNINYNSIGSRKESIELIDIFNEHNENISYKALNDEDYTGSYHLWITAPYDKKLSKTKFLNIHANLANKLQLLEPIIACNFSSPSYQIKYNKDYHYKLSLRHLLNNYAGYGTSDVSLINGTDYTYISDIFFEKKNNPNVHKILRHKKKVYNENNTLIKSYDALDTRHYTNNIYNFLHNKINNSKNINVKSYYELLFKNKYLSFKEFQKIFTKEENKRIKPIHIDLGADIRTRNNNYLMYPLDNNIKKIYYPKNNKYIEYYIDENNELLNKRKYNSEKYEKFLSDERVGFEFRILDHFPTIYLDMILSILPYLVMESYETYPINNINDTFVSKQFWHNEMFKVITDGYKHNFTKIYINKINKELNINIKFKKYTSELLLEEIYKELINKYSKLRKYKVLLDKLKFDSQILFINFHEFSTKFIESNN